MISDVVTQYLNCCVKSSGAKVYVSSRKGSQADGSHQFCCLLGHSTVGRVGGH